MREPSLLEGSGHLPEVEALVGDGHINMEENNIPSGSEE